MTEVLTVEVAVALAAVKFRARVVSMDWVSVVGMVVARNVWVASFLTVLMFVAWAPVKLLALVVVGFVAREERVIVAKVCVVVIARVV